jgi:ADP-heptose:LPS heptosyltransferase
VPVTSAVAADIRRRSKYAGAAFVDALLRLASHAGLIRPGGLPDEHGPISRVLMLSLDNLGDAILATPAIEALKRTLPETKLTVLCRPVAFAVFDGNPYVDELITDDAPWWSAAPVSGSLNLRYWKRYLRAVRRLCRDQYDVIVDLRGDLRHLVLFGLFTRPRILLGYDRNGGAVVLSVCPRYERDTPEIDKKLLLLRPLGVNGIRPAASIWVRPDEIDAARQLAEARGVRSPLVLMDPGAKSVQRWPQEQFAEVARSLRAKTGQPVLVSAGPAYARLAQEVARTAGYEATRLVGELSIRQLIGVVAVADLVISADTGILHIAAAVGSPSVGVFGPTDPRRFWHAAAPSEFLRSGSACRRSDLHDTCRFAPPGRAGLCMGDVKTGDVMGAAVRVLAAGKASFHANAPAAAMP